MDNATYTALEDVYDVIGTLSNSHKIVASRLIDSLALLVDKHLALEERVAKLEEKERKGCLRI